MSSVTNYCTYFDERYLARGLALYSSMRRYCAPFRLWVLCMSDECYRQLTALDLDDVVPLRLEEIENADPELAATKQSRSMLEYYFTCTAALLTWLLTSRIEADTLTYLDADLFFFSRPDFLLEEFATSSVLIIPHRFSSRNQSEARWGIYNVGWITFRKDEEGLRCLGWWRERCIEWCYDIEEPERFADQKYLDAFPKLFSRVQIDMNPGVNLAPWNLDNYRISEGADGKVLVEGSPVIFFHFHKLRRVTRFLWRTAHHEFGAPLDRTVRQLLYGPYLEALDAAERLTENFRFAVPLRRDRFEIGKLSNKLRATLAIIWRGGGVWVLGKRVL
jgi:hypothetical protein